MNELLKKLLAAEVLTEETKQELEAAFTNQLNEAIQKARDEAQATVTAELNEQWINERETLIEALDTKITESLEQEMKELKEDIEQFRDLEAEYAEKLVEAKGEMAVAVKSDIAQLIEKLDTWMEIRLTSELEELREDVEMVKKNEFGKKVFEAFIDEFKKHYAGDDSVEGRLAETEQRLDDALTALEEAEKKANKLDRAMKMEKTLTPLTGRSREVMEAILKNVDTNLLEDAYGTYIGRVLRESSTDDSKTSEKEEKKVLAEGKEEKKITGVTRTGDTNGQTAEEKEQLEENYKPTGVGNTEAQRMRRLAGLV